MGQCRVGGTERGTDGILECGAWEEGESSAWPHPRSAPGGGGTDD